jgi:hypothetical protein
VNEIVTRCAACGHQTECSLSLAGKEIECEACKATIRAPRSPRNPFARPMGGIVDQLKEIQWEAPFLAQSMQAVVLSLVFLIILLLAITIGVAFQIGGVFQVLLIDASARVKTGGFVERSAYAISAGIYFLLYVPFWVIQFPFAFIGWLWTFSRLVALIFALFLIAVLTVVLLDPVLAKAMLEAFMAKVLGLVDVF